MASRLPWKTALFYLLTLMAVVGGAVFWMSDLTSDPPMYYSGLGQSLGTDPAEYIHHARNKVLLGQWDPYDYPRWTVYQHSLTSLVGYLWFSHVGEVTIKQAGTVGVLLSLGALILFVLGLARHHRPWVVAVFALCYVINVTLLTYGRLSYLENGLLFWTALLFFVYCRWHERLWGVVAAGAIVALATFTGKLFGALLLPALCLTVFLSVSPTKRWRFVIATAAGYAVASAALVVILYGGDFFAAFAYVGEQSYGLRGFPAGLSSPWGFFEHLVAYGFKNRLFYLDPDIFMFLLAACGLLVFVNKRAAFRELSPAIKLACFCAATVFLGLMPLNYSPLRYALFLIPAVIIACFGQLDHLLNREKTGFAQPGRAGVVLLGLLCWFALYQVVGNVFYFNFTPYRALAWGTLPGAILVALLLRYLLGKWQLRVSRTYLICAVILLVGLSAVANGFRIRRLHYLDHNFNLLDANEDLSHILGPDAVVSGPYGPAMTVDTDLGAFIHFFGVATVDSTLFDRQPVTHLAMDASNLKEAAKAYKQLVGQAQIATYWIRDFEVKLFNISKLFTNPQANAYQETHYEKAVAYFHAGNLDSAMVEINRHLESHPLTRSVGLLAADILGKTSKTEETVRVMTTLANKYPTDFYIQMQCGRLYLIVALANKNQSLMNSARMYFERGIKANRFKTDLANKLLLDTQRLYGRQAPGGGR
ncbi:MAG: hypothetical protein KAU35_04975 [candidate division Zixibacteria bacterium]|nr:hypothetical protein [candidate division Zixibacteria bacterium]